ncbi:hypothetical protein Ahy_B02g060936 [Arachis hypogaea]|uniref:Uncharacterized protein n=1 Tax=Arachis hypogaea TaxID=3818 RepID=A0A445AJM7_ARAHY|nr:hypothetical protein Ahy_B02g060936 [Arachis hypogaea]
MLEQNLKEYMAGIDKELWRWFLDYRNDPDTKEKCRKIAVNRSKLLYTHTGSSKSWARRRKEESERQGRRIGKGELWILVHKQHNDSCLHDKARRIGKIVEIEQRDESTRILSENDSLAQALEKEHSGTVRGVDFGLTLSELFYPSLHLPVDGAQTDEAQRMLFELQAEVMAKKLRRKAVKDEIAEGIEDEVAAEKLKRMAVEDDVAAEKTKR